MAQEFNDLIDLAGLDLDLPDLDTLGDLDNFTPGAARDFALAQRTRARKVRTFDLANLARSTALIKTLPEPLEYVHVIVGQDYAGLHLIRTFLALSGAKKFDRLYLTTLGLSAENLADLVDLIESGKLAGRNLTVLCGDFFRRGDAKVWQIGAELARRHRFGFRSARNHAKLILAKLAGRCFVVEGSANLRSCQNAEQFTLTQNRDLYRFHAGWIDQLFAAGHD